MKASMILWLAVMSYIIAAMVAIGFGAVASFGVLFICAILMAVFAMNMMAKEKVMNNAQNKTL
jgi:hypothetical protein